MNGDMAMSKATDNDNSPIEQLAYSRAQFCKAAGNLSKQRFYDLLRSGEGPETFLIGRRRMVLAGEAKRWIKQKAEESKAAARAAARRIPDEAGVAAASDS